MPAAAQSTLAQPVRPKTIRSSGKHMLNRGAIPAGEEWTCSHSNTGYICNYIKYQYYNNLKYGFRLAVIATTKTIRQQKYNIVRNTMTIFQIKRREKGNSGTTFQTEKEKRTYTYIHI